MNDPYRAPVSETVHVPEPPRPGSVARAVLVGVTVDVALTVVVSFVVGFAAATLIGTGGKGEELVGAMDDPFSPVMLVATVLGLTVSFYAGLTCCRMAGTNARRAIIIMALVMAAFALWASYGTYGAIDSLLLVLLSWVMYWQAYVHFWRISRRGG